MTGASGVYTPFVAAHTTISALGASAVGAGTTATGVCLSSWGCPLCKVNDNEI